MKQRRSGDQVATDCGTGHAKRERRRPVIMNDEVHPESLYEQIIRICSVNVEEADKNLCHCVHVQWHVGEKTGKGTPGSNPSVDVINAAHQTAVFAVEEAGDAAGSEHWR